MKVESKSAEGINLALRDHQATAEGWDFKALSADLHLWAERMIFQFKLEIGTPALMVDRLRCQLGHYRQGRNGFGLRDEITIDEGHVRGSPYWRQLGTLLHELLHS